jgi:hypothetical protein
MTTDLPTVAELRKLLLYDPETGLLSWKTRPAERKSWNTRYAGTPALHCIHEDGYRKGRIRRVLFRAHRVAWALHHGSWPAGHIDHINGDRADNRIANLRDVTRHENQRNMRRPSDNTSGRIGVWWHKRNQKWVAEIRTAGRKKHLGSFARFEEACRARAEAEQADGYHENHGRHT